jgi:hypothetical protein
MKKYCSSTTRPLSATTSVETHRERRDRRYRRRTPRQPRQKAVPRARPLVIIGHNANSSFIFDSSRRSARTRTRKGPGHVTAQKIEKEEDSRLSGHSAAR